MLSHAVQGKFCGYEMKSQGYPICEIYFMSRKYVELYQKLIVLLFEHQSENDFWSCEMVNHFGLN